MSTPVKRVLMVDDSELFTRQLGRRLAAADGFEVVGTARHGLAALEMAEALRPDLVTLDVRMPVMDGVATLKRLMTRRPVATVMLTAWSSEDSHLTFECLRYGAVDFVLKPSGEWVENGQGRDLVATLRRAAEVAPPGLRFCRLREQAAPSPQPGDGRRPDEGLNKTNRHPLPRPGRRAARQAVVCLAGRGGLMPLLELLGHLPPGLEAAIVVRLSLANEVVGSFARYLTRFSPQPVLLPGGEDGDGVTLTAGTTYLLDAKTPYMVVQERGRACLKRFRAPEGADAERLQEAFCESAAELFGDRAVAVVLPDAFSPRGLGSLPCLASRAVGDPEDLAGRLFDELLRRSA